jgi:hypothetical protein
MYQPKYFNYYEFVPAHVAMARGEKSLQLMDDRILRVADWLRNRFGPMTINSWWWGGTREWSGLRTALYPGFDAVSGNNFSQHYRGAALDGLFKNATAEEVRQDLIGGMILDELDLECITIENDVSWLHVDVRMAEPGINFFDP